MDKQLPGEEKVEYRTRAAELAGWKDTKKIMALSLLTLIFFYAMAEGMLRGRGPAETKPSTSSAAACSSYNTVQSGSSSSSIAAGRRSKAMVPTSALGDNDKQEEDNTNYRTVGAEPDRLEYDDEVRHFRAYGTAAALYVVYGSYRGGEDTFVVVGLGAKSTYQFEKPGFKCEWVEGGGSAAPPTREAYPAPEGGGAVSVTGRPLLPDLGYGRVYSVVVVNCTFPRAVGSAGQGGQLVLHASYGSGDGIEEPPPERIVAFREPPGSYDPDAFSPPFPYDFVYCGSPLYGDVSPDRVREWLAHHVRLMGPRVLIVLHDAGGLGPAARAAIAPWQRLGFVRIQNIRRQAAFDGYYYNQFLVLNDCLHRTRFLARWTFFFDLDEYLYIDPARTLLSVMDSYSSFTEVKFRQTFMVKGLCQPPNTTTEESGDTRWGIEKLIYRDMEDRLAHSSNKYAIQARNVFANGVHNAELGSMIGDWKEAEWWDLKFFHYHGTINIQGDLCKEYTQNMSLTHGNTIYQVEPSLALLAPSIKEFEFKKIGNMINLSPIHAPSPSKNVTN